MVPEFVILGALVAILFGAVLLALAARSSDRPRTSGRSGELPDGSPSISVSGPLR